MLTYLKRKLFDCALFIPFSLYTFGTVTLVYNEHYGISNFPYNQEVVVATLVSMLSCLGLIFKNSHPSKDGDGQC